MWQLVLVLLLINLLANIIILTSYGTSDIPRNFFGGEVQQIQLRTEGRENGDLGAVAP
jgi:hypothetical protein